MTFVWDAKTRLVLFSQVIDMPEHNPGNLGGTMRLGIRRTVFKTENSILSKFLRWFALRHGVSFALPLPPPRPPLSFQTSSHLSPPNLLLPSSFPWRGWWDTRGCPFPLISMTPCPVGCLRFPHVPGHDLSLGEPWFQLGSLESLHYVGSHPLFTCFMSNWLVPLI